MEEENSQTSTKNAELQQPPKLEFKKPILVGKVGKSLKRPLDNAGSTSSEAPEPDSSENEKKKPSDRRNLAPAMLLKELTVPIPYKEPKWSGQCPDGSDYAFEVLKSGMIVETIDLTQKPYYVFGRFSNCDVVLGHPTISRHHAILQYKAFADESEPAAGWYIYDLGSSHGTFLNKQRLKSHGYVRVRVGHQVKFGNSTRTYVLTGPDFDCEGESDLTVTEIKAKALVMRRERDNMLLEAKELRDRDRADAEKRREDMGVDWGMGEDAEDDLDGLMDNPYAVTTNEELYLEDPKKTLRGYYEREGLELVYNCEERGQGQFICSVELPIDDVRGRPVKAEVIHKGKKKEAVVACALEACRILDRAGLLRQAKHESRRKKERDWSADDYYDSDDDCFLDRTGSVEKKRDARMKKYSGEARQSTSEAPLTYETLQQKVKEIESKIALEEKSLKSLREVGRTPGSSETCDDGDPLDNYMRSLAKQGPSMAQKADISNTKMTIKKLQAELAKTQRLAELARPAHLPPLLKKDQSKPSVKVASNSVVYGKRIKLKDDQDMKPKPKQSHTQSESEFVEEMDSEEDEIQKPTEIISEKPETNKQAVPETYPSENNIEESQIDPAKQKNLTKSEIDPAKSETEQAKSENEQNKSETEQPKAETEQNKSETEQPKAETEQNKSEKNRKVTESSQKKQYGPMRPPENYVMPASYFDQTSDRDLPEIMDEN